MNKVHFIINGKKQKGYEFTQEEIKSLFGDDKWNRTFKDQEFLKSVGLTAPPSTFLAAGSYSSVPTNEGKIAGICVLRTDEKDRPKGFPINWNHWDFFLHEGKVIMIPHDDKRPDHWFKSDNEWKQRIKEKPPHQDKLKENSSKNED